MNKSYLVIVILVLVIATLYISMNDEEYISSNQSSINYSNVQNDIKIEAIESDIKKSSVKIEYIEEQVSVEEKLNLVSEKSNKKSDKDHNYINIQRPIKQDYTLDDIVVGNDNVKEYIEKNNLKIIAKRVSSNIVKKENKSDRDKLTIFRIDVLSNLDVVYNKSAPPKVPKYLYGIFETVQEPFKVQIPLELKSDIVSLKVTNTKTNDIIIQNFDISDMASGDFKKIDIMEP